MMRESPSLGQFRAAQRTGRGQRSKDLAVVCAAQLHSDTLLGHTCMLCSPSSLWQVLNDNRVTTSSDPEAPGTRHRVGPHSARVTASGTP